MASTKTTTRKSRAKAKPAPEETKGADSSIASATAAATTENNPASTTKANDPDRDNEAAALAAAQASGTAQDAGAAPNTGDTPADPDAPAAGDRASHPAQTTAEATAAGAAAEFNLSATTMPAGDDAAPDAAVNQTQEFGAEGESTQDESGAIQEATRRAIGAGFGAPDGISGGGEDPASSDADQPVDEDIEPVDLPNGEKLTGRKAKLFRMIEKGATQAEMLKATGSTSVLGSINVLARRAGRELEAKKNKDGVRVYKLKK